MLCGYLLFRSSQLADNTTHTSDFCQMVFGTTCDELLSSRIAWHLGYPLAGWGLVYFGLLGVLLAINIPSTNRIAVLMSALGTGASIFQSFILLKSVLSCPLCFIIHGINVLLLLALIFYIIALSSGETSAMLRKKSSFLRWGGIILIAGLVGGFAEYHILKRSMGYVSPEEVYANYQNEIIHEIPIEGNAPRLGNIDAPVQMVVFSSFQCPACKSFANISRELYDNFNKNLTITFKNFPLSSKCNPAIDQNMQPLACEASFAAIAAHQQNQFWVYHDQLFQTDFANDPMAFVTIAENIGLDIEQWKADIYSQGMLKTLSEDLKLAYELEINATPTVFINGRRTSNLQESVLTHIIQKELQRSAN